MDSKVKERIIGAAVLVALGVWLIPWVLDGSDSSGNRADADREVELLPAGNRAPVVTETVDLEPAPERSRTEEPEPTQALIEPPEIIDAAPAAVADEAIAAPPRETPIAASVSAPAADPGGWSVQLGSFGELANARQLASRVSEFGFAAQVSDYRSNGRIMHRVRVEGFKTRDQAEAAASSLAAHDFVARVFSPAE